MLAPPTSAHCGTPPNSSNAMHFSTPKLQFGAQPPYASPPNPVCHGEAMSL